MKISVYQKIGRSLITIMTVGAAALLTCYLIVGLNGDGPDFTSSGIERLGYPYIVMACRILTPVSYLLELLGLMVWPSPSFMTPVSAYCVVMAFVLGNLFLSRYLTKFKGTRTAIAVNLALILLDLPFALVCCVRSAEFGLAASGFVTLIINLFVHLSAAFFLIMAFRYTIKNEMWFSDLCPSPCAEHIRSYHSEIREGMTDKEIKAVWNRLVFPRIARVVTVLVALGTAVTLCATVIGYFTDYSAFSFVVFLVMFMGSILSWYFGNIVTDSGTAVQIGVGLCILAFVAGMLFTQRFFTRDSRLTKPALVFTLTAAVIDTLPFVSVAGQIGFINAIIHVLWMTALTISLIKVCRREKNAEIPPTDTEEKKLSHGDATAFSIYD